jgi:MFS family permease
MYGLYSAMTDGVQKAYIADLVSKEERGTAMGTFNALTGIAALPASLIAGFLWDRYGSFATFLTSCILAVVAAVLFSLPIGSKKRREEA